jgi:hypothetical protein
VTSFFELWWSLARRRSFYRTYDGKSSTERKGATVADQCGAGGSKLDQVNEAQLGPEDLKIITLARSARARAGSAQGAAVRDETGRTYAATTIALPSLQLSALALAVAMAASSGATALEAAAVVGGPGLSDADAAVVRDLGPDAVIIDAGSDGVVRHITLS